MHCKVFAFQALKTAISWHTHKKKETRIKVICKNHFSMQRSEEADLWLWVAVDTQHSTRYAWWFTMWMKVFKRIFLCLLAHNSLLIRLSNVCAARELAMGRSTERCVWNNFMRIIKFICTRNATHNQKLTQKKETRTQQTANADAKQNENGNADKTLFGLFRMDRKRVEFQCRYSGYTAR